ncbi:MAG: hypothetical protein ACJ8GM_00305, partial [Paraburkholderia fungorum]
ATDSRCTTTATVRGTRLRISGVSRFLLPTFLCGRQRKVGAAPHRGNANKPIRKQGKAKRPDHDHSKKKPKEPDQEKANAAGKKNQPTPRPRLKKSLP